jgi:hypothetical protein
MDGPTRDPSEERAYSEAKRAASPSNPTRIPVTEQEKLTDELHMVIGDLTNRLEAVLTPENQVNEGNASGTEPDEPKSQMAYRVEDNNRKVRSAIRKIRNLIERIES